MKIQTSELLKRLQCHSYYYGNIQQDPIITGVAPLHSAQPDQLTYSVTPKFDTNAIVIICPLETEASKDKVLIRMNNPRLGFIRAMQIFPIPKPSIKLGNNVKLDPGVRIGMDGFGFERDETGRLIKFPHIGGVVIEDDVEVGPNTCIDRGTLEDTVIGEGSKIDNLCHIAHNCCIGKHVLIVAGTILGGSSIIDDFATIYPNAYILPHKRVGKWAVIGPGAVVRDDVPDGETWVGVPAEPIWKIKERNEKLALLLDHIHHE